MKTIKTTIAFFILVSFLSMSTFFKPDCLTTFNTEVNAAGSELEADLVHCSEVSYAASLCRQEARLFYERGIDGAVSNFETC
jgi:hypothetical protein